MPSFVLGETNNNTNYSYLLCIRDNRAKRKTWEMEASSINKDDWKTQYMNDLRFSLITQVTINTINKA